MNKSLLESYPTPSPARQLQSLSAPGRETMTDRTETVVPFYPAAHHHQPVVSMIHPNIDPSQAPTSISEEGIRILVVDDEKPMRMMARVIVESIGFEAIEASSGEEALLIYREYAETGDSIDLVIMDLALPGGISGLEATRSLLEFDENASVMVSSGYLSQNSRQAAMQQGFAGVLPKPYTVDRLSSEIHYILSHRESVRH